MKKQTLSAVALTGLAWFRCGHAEVLGCLIEPDRVADVGSQSTGVIEKLMVERGDAVAAGQVLARLTAQVERASVSVAETKARAEAETLQAQAAYELAQRKLERTRDLVKRDFVSDQALDQAEAEARVAQQRVEQAREAQRVAQKEYMLSNAQLSQRDVRSPFAGVVVERYRTEGERVEREPVARVARLDPLRVEAIVPAAQFGSVKEGQQASIRTDLPEFPAMTAQVTLVDRVVDPASNSFRVRLLLPNPGNRIPSGLRCHLALGGPDAGEGSGAPARPKADAAPQRAPSRPSTVSPAHWPGADERAGGGRMMTVSYTQGSALPAPWVDATPPGASRKLVSSTLKMAMTELARMTPGAHYLPPPAVAVAEAPAAGKVGAHGHKARLVMSVRLPTLGSPADAPRRSSHHVTSSVVAAADHGKPASDVRLASVR